MTSPRRLGGIITRATAAGALILGTVAIAAAPAQAATWTGYVSGPVGVPQTISVQGVCNSSTLTFTAQYSNGMTSSAPSVGADINGNATITWTPDYAGLVTQATIGSTCSPVQLGGVNITKVATTTTVNAPNNATIGQSTKIEVIVQSTSPSSYNPTGQITVVNANGAAVSGVMGLTPGPGNGQSYAYFWWTPPTAGSYYFKAQYGGDSNAAGSPMSALDTTIATPSGNTISISAPPTMTQGQSVTLTATVFPAGVQGAVGFTINGQPISASIALNPQGQASFTWTPNVVGQVTLGANYTTNGGGTGSTSELVTVNAGPVQKDVITLVQPGFGAWAPNGTYTLGNGSNFTFQATSLSGAPVTLTETGPCGVSGLTLNVPVGQGQCNLQASTNGGNGYAPMTYGYTVNAVPGNQVANITAPQSGRYNAGRTLVLEGAGNADTNAGQNINWFITKGKGKICKLQFQGNGAVKLKLIKKGHCMVKGNAAGVPGQWNPYSIRRSYHAI